MHMTTPQRPHRVSTPRARVQAGHCRGVCHELRLYDTDAEIMHGRYVGRCSGKDRPYSRDDAAPHARNHADKTQFLNNYKTKIDALLNLPDRRVPIHRLKETAIPLCTKQISLGSYI